MYEEINTYPGHINQPFDLHLECWHCPYEEEEVEEELGPRSMDTPSLLEEQKREAEDECQQETEWHEEVGSIHPLR